MGLGKTLICIAIIVATKGHFPKIPPQYSTDLNPIRPRTGTLMQMAAATIGREQIPWRAIFQDLEKDGELHGGCLNMLEENNGSYFMPLKDAARRRNGGNMTHNCIYLCSATLIIVPENLFFQWKNQISLHVEQDTLKVLYVDTLRDTLPPTADLLTYDVILISKKRFVQEMDKTDQMCHEGKDPIMKSSSPQPCSDRHQAVKYRCSVLRKLHFLRIIVDEGHDFAASGRRTEAVWALRDLLVERRWIVSGTPTTGLIGVELDLAANETSELGTNNPHILNQELLESRKLESIMTQERKDLNSLGRTVIDFLQLSPWANIQDDLASWQKYVMPSKDGKRKHMSLRSILGGLVVRHQIDDVNADIQLPPLKNTVVYLNPSFHDKLSINMFILSLTANAITSERTDKDYMFHPSNRAQLDLLVNNLRHSGFYWVGFTPQSIAKTLDVCRSFLETARNEDSPSLITIEDQALLKQVMCEGEQALASPSWNSFARLQEMGIYVDNFPQNACDAWSLIQRGEHEPVLFGVTQLIKAQEHVDSRLYSSDPAYGLAGLGKRTMEALQPKQIQEAGADLSKQSGSAKNVRGSNVAYKYLHSEPSTELRLTEKNTISKTVIVSGRGIKRNFQHVNDLTSSHSVSTSKMKSALKPLASFEENATEQLPSDSALAQVTMIGTASAKLSYLIEKVLVLQQDEKILVFYRGDDIAYFIAQAFDLIGIQYLIYTGKLSKGRHDRRETYINVFNVTERFRVMLMDVRQAAHGLHIASASRVFFVNPEWQPNVEAQAIKRAHRIGQTRPVHVETLVLKDTLEDKMLQRRKIMSTEEHQSAKNSLIDDPVMRDLIKTVKPVSLSAEEIGDVRLQMAPLNTPQRIFGRIEKVFEGEDDLDTNLGLSSRRSSGIRKQSVNKRQSSSNFGTADIPLPPKRKLDNGSGEDVLVSRSNRNPSTPTGADNTLDNSAVLEGSSSEAMIINPTRKRVAFSVD